VFSVLISAMVSYRLIEKRNRSSKLPFLLVKVIELLLHKAATIYFKISFDEMNDIHHFCKARTRLEALS